MPVGTLNPAFQWTIPLFRDTLRLSRFLYVDPVFKGDCIDSPDFHLSCSSWCLRLNIFPSARIGISLVRRDSGVPKTVTYTIKITDTNGVQKINETSCFHTRNTLCGKSLKFFPDKVAYSDLLVTCCIKCSTPHPVAGKDLMTCAVHTVTNSVTEKENPKNDYLSSLDMKGKDLMTCAVHTVTNSVTEKENPKNDYLSSLDMKDDALLRERMKKLLTKGSDYDVTICVQDKEFRAHRNILSARSPVFSMMLSNDTIENNTGTISIEDCDPESFDEFLLYVYSGRTENLTPSNALQLYYPADKYDFPVLKERCVSLLKTSLSVESICDSVLLAAKHHEKELLDAATVFFAWNMKKILITLDWQKFMSQNPVEANELIIKSMEILLPEN